MTRRHFIQGAVFLVIGLAVGGLMALIAIQGWFMGLLVLGITYTGLVMAAWFNEDERARRR